MREYNGLIFNALGACKIHFSYLSSRSDASKTYCLTLDCLTMTHIRNTLHELLKEELTSEILSNFSVPEDELIRLKVHLTQQPVQPTGCCISITQGKYGLVVSNIGGPIEEVLGRRVCVEIDNAGDLSDAEVLGLVLQALFISGYSAHLHSDNEVV